MADQVRHTFSDDPPSAWQSTSCIAPAAPPMLCDMYIWVCVYLGCCSWRHQGTLDRAESGLPPWRNVDPLFVVKWPISQG